MIHVRSLLGMLALASLACGGGPVHTRAPDQMAPWLLEDPQRCLLMRDLGEGMEFMAQRCAEDFARQNGYTHEPPTSDETRWVLESNEGGPWHRIFASRLGSLESQASTAQCSMRQCLVLFRLRRPALDCDYRAVTMSQVFTRLRLEPGRIRYVRCSDRQA